MKLCDRCPQAGSCLLNYLGKACEHARKEVDPTLVPTNAEAFPALSYEDLAAFLCFSNSHAMSYERTLAFLKAPFERRKPDRETL